MQTSNLKYLFEAEFADGEIYRQNSNDVSPYEEGKSCFYDVLQKGKAVRRFTLVGEFFRASVFLSDGHFEVLGMPFRVYESDKPVKERELVFARRHWQDMNANPETHKVTLGGHRMCYRIGWRGIDMTSGETVERVLEID